MINLHLIVLLPLLMGVINLLLPQKFSEKLILVFQFFLMIPIFAIFLKVRENGSIIEHIGGWPKTIGITLRADILASTMVLLTCFLFLMMLIFVQKKSYADSLFYFLFLSLQALIIGIFLSNDLFNIFVLIEAATLIITLLILYKKGNPAIYDGILYFLINTVAMSFFLLGIGMLYKKIGVVDFSAIELHLSQLKDVKSMILPYSFLITAISLKSALMPLFSWLPKAHGTPSAPSVVSAILSGLYVKMGIYLFLRLQSAFLPIIDTSQLFLIVGFITAIIGFLLALAQKDIKLILAYHTISQVGLIMVGINMGSPQAYWGGLYHIINHAIFKSTLFLTAGMIIDSYKTRNIYEIKGVFKKLPVVGVAMIVSILGITGAPLFNGSISKYLISSGSSEAWIEYGLMLINLGTILSFIKYSQMLFGQAEKKEPTHSRIRENIVVLTLSILCFAGGILGNVFIELLFNIDISVNLLSYGIKALLFIGSLLLGMIIYYLLIRKKNYFAIIHGLDLGFNEACLSITLFFALMVFYLKITI